VYTLTDQHREQDWFDEICGARHRGMLCNRQADHDGDHVDIFGPLPGHTWTQTEALRERLGRERSQDD